MATVEHKFHRLFFSPANQELNDFMDEIQKLAENGLPVAAQAINEQLIYAKKLPHKKKLIKQPNSENDTYEAFVSFLEKDLELYGWEDPDEMKRKHFDATSHKTKS